VLNAISDYCLYPKPDTLKIEGDWEKAKKKSLEKKKPATGWPK
jgi:hypothetical protein